MEGDKSLIKGLCARCSKRPICTKLCKEALRYVNQDYTCLKELPICWPEPRKLEISGTTYLTTREREIVTLLGKDLTRADVCQLLNMTRHTLRNHLYNLRKKRDDLYLYIEGYENNSSTG